ncbi:MAG: carbonic anhydrase family protein [Gammaproteobacteria bacterium]|nr:carbonic anhydrase family protein [Gammaproteobacteria bacterium]
MARKLIFILTATAFLITSSASVSAGVKSRKGDSDDDAPVSTHSEVKKSHKTSTKHTMPHWDYENPADWADLSPDFHLCKGGTRQSPIDITKTKKTPLGSIIFNYKKGPKEIVNNGHTIQVNMHKGNYITVSGKRYDLLQFHFHSPSEHTVDGKPADLVAHFVHKARDGELGVVAVLFKDCQENNTVSELWRKMPDKVGKKNKLSRKIKVLNMFPKNRGYYNYSGSLTTPPCSEGVNWMVLKNTVPVSDAQIKSFVDIFPKSVRPIQEKYHRVVKTR